MSTRVVIHGNLVANNSHRYGPNFRTRTSLYSRYPWHNRDHSSRLRITSAESGPRRSKTLLGHYRQLGALADPAPDTAPEDVQHHIEIVVSPLHRAAQFSDVPGTKPVWARWPTFSFSPYYIKLTPASCLKYYWHGGIPERKGR